MTFRTQHHTHSDRCLSLTITCEDYDKPSSVRRFKLFNIHCPYALCKVKPVFFHFILHWEMPLSEKKGLLSNQVIYFFCYLLSEGIDPKGYLRKFSPTRRTQSLHSQAESLRTLIFPY